MDGIQHFQLVERFGGKRQFEQTQNCDQEKNRLCVDNNIHLLRISYNVKMKDYEYLVRDFFETVSKLKCNTSIIRKIGSEYCP